MYVNVPNVNSIYVLVTFDRGPYVRLVVMLNMLSSYYCQFTHAIPGPGQA